MINKKTTVLVFLGFLAALTLPLYVSAQPDMSPEESLGPAHILYNPSIWENNVVWRNYDSAAQQWQICLGDVVTGSTLVISEGTENKYQPHIQGNRIVWTDTRNGDPLNSNPDIYMYNLKNGQETRVTFSDDPNVWEQYPGVYGNYVVWMSLYHNVGMDGIWLRNVKKGSAPIRISSQDTTQYPVIYGNRVVYTDASHIYVYTISKKTEEGLDILPGRQFMFLDLWGDKLIWSEIASFWTYNGQRRMLCRIRMVDFSRPDQVDTIAENLHSLPQPRISRNRIVWCTVPDPDSRNVDIYMYDLGPDGIKSEDDSYFPVTTDPSPQAYPDIYDISKHGIGMSVVAWKDQRNVVPQGGEAEVYWRLVFHLP